MHLPPPAQWNKRRGRAHGLAVVFLSVLNASLIFAAHGHVVEIAWWGVLAFSAAISAHAAWRWLRAPVGFLRWTGENWLWSQALGVPNPQACEIRWSLDFQTFVLVQMRLIGVAGPKSWIWLERGDESPLAWLAIRRALVAARESPTQSGAEARG